MRRSPHLFQAPISRTCGWRGENAQEPPGCKRDAEQIVVLVEARDERGESEITAWFLCDDHAQACHAVFSKPEAVA